MNIELLGQFDPLCLSHSRLIFSCIFGILGVMFTAMRLFMKR